MAASALAGAANWALVDLLKLHPLVATLATFMAYQAASLMLRPVPDGPVGDGVIEVLSTKLWGIPVSIMVAAVVALLLEFALFKSALGMKIRGTGSRPEAAAAAGVGAKRIRLVCYVGCSILTGLAAVTVIPQVGIGDARAGLGYTLASVAAVAIGGASLAGGRGSFAGALLGAVFMTQANAVTTFLGLNQAWQSYLLGGMTIAAVALYSLGRERAARS
jgi:ribose transport system ATP-binding protein